MTARSIKPSYNLKVVVRETGIKPDTLRAWERRYHLPTPERTAGGHRLYSPRDLDTIKWLLARQEEGLSISKAVQLWQDMEAAGEDPLWQAERPVVGQALPVTADHNLTEIRQAWLSACLNFDETAAEQALSQAFALYSPELVCLEVLQKGLSEIGSLWYENKATVQQEHFTSALAMRRLNTLMTAAPTPTRARPLLVCCPPEEEHTFAALLLSLLLRYNGWGVIYLGANVPLARLENTLQAARPALVVLTAQTLHTAALLLEMAHFLREQKIPLAYGGLVFNRMPIIHQRIPGHFTGADIIKARQHIETILETSPPLPEVVPISEAYRRALDCYRENQMSIENHVWQTLQNKGISSAHLRMANLHLARDITAALTFGDMALLDQQISWTEQLLANFAIPRHFLLQYLNVYCEIANKYLGPDCSPVTEWLKQNSADPKREM